MRSIDPFGFLAERKVHSVHQAWEASPDNNMHWLPNTHSMNQYCSEGSGNPTRSQMVKMGLKFWGGGGGGGVEDEGGRRDEEGGGGEEDGGY